MAKAKKKKLKEEKIAAEQAAAEANAEQATEAVRELTAEDWQDKFLRAQADLQNIRRRLGEETEERVRLRMEGLLHDLIRVADYMEAALGSIPEPVQKAEQADAFLMGITAIQQALESVMIGHGMVFLKPAAQEAYNPDEHEAVETVVDESLQEPQLELISRGYRIGKRILRPAKVKVVTPTPLADSAPDSAPDSASNSDEDGASA